MPNPAFAKSVKVLGMNTARAPPSDLFNCFYLNKGYEHHLGTPSGTAPQLLQASHTEVTWLEAGLSTCYSGSSHASVNGFEWVWYPGECTGGSASKIRWVTRPGTAFKPSPQHELAELKVHICEDCQLEPTWKGARLVQHLKCISPTSLRVPGRAQESPVSACDST